MVRYYKVAKGYVWLRSSAKEKGARGLVWPRAMVRLRWLRAMFGLKLGAKEEGLGTRLRAIGLD